MSQNWTKMQVARRWVLWGWASRALARTPMSLVTRGGGTCYNDFEETFGFYYVHQCNEMTRTEKPTLEIRSHADVCRPHADLDWHLPHLGCSDINFSLAKINITKLP